MSNLGLHNSNQALIVKNSAISNADMTKSLGAVATNIEYIGNVIGDVNGYGTSGDKTFKTSLSGSIGDMQKVSIDLPLGAEFSDYSESFTTEDKNDFILSLIPLGDLTITDKTGTAYQKVDKGFLRNNNEYTLDGRKLVFHTKPEQSFSIIYKGKYPSIDGINQEGYTPNVYPSPELISRGLQDRASIEFKGNGYYELTIHQQNRNSYDELFSSKLEYSLSEKLKQFISPTGGTICPSEHIGVWKLFGDKFQRVEDAEISILAPNKIRFQTGININPTSDLLVVSVNNWTVADTLNALTHYMLKHRHTASEVGSQILHKDIIGLRAERYSKDEQQYGESIIRGDDHPQYFNREGYIQNNPGNFNNAIIGDVLIGSTSNYNLYNNTLSDSRKLYFGAISAASLMFDSEFKGILLYSADNGLKIESKSATSNSETKFGVALNADEHLIYSHGGVSKDVNGVVTKTPNVLRVDAKDGLIEMNNQHGGGASLTLKNINTETAKVSGTVTFPTDESGIKIGDVKFANKDGDVNISSDDNKSLVFKANAEFQAVDIATLTPKLITIKDDAKIRFGEEDASDHIRALGTTIDIVNKKPMSFSNTGKNTGLGFMVSAYKPFMNLYSSAEGGGSSTPTDHDTYLESGSGSVYLLKDSTSPQLENGTTFLFGKDPESGSNNKRVDNLKQWPRASLYGALGDFHSINVLASSLKDRRGINFDDSASIYATGNDTECPPGWLVLESKNGAVFIDARAGATDCQTIVYSDVSTGPLKVFGDATVDKNVGVSGDVNVNGEITAQELAIDGKGTIGNLEVKEDSKFTGSVQFTENVAINSELDVGGAISTSNKLTANELEIKSRTFLLGPVDLSNTLNVEGVINTTKSIAATGDIRTSGKLTATDMLAESGTIYSLRTTDAINAQGGIVSNGSIQTVGNLETDSDLIADGGKFSTQVRTNNLVVERDTTIGNELYVEGKFQAAGEITLGTNGQRMAVNSNTIFNNNKTSMLGTLEVTQESRFKGDVEVIGEIVVGSVSEFKGGITIGGPVRSSSSADYQSLRIADQSQLLGDVQVGSRLSVADSATIKGGLNVKGDSVIGDDSSVVVMGGRTQFNRAANFTNDVTMSGSVAISGNARITGEMEINSKVSVEGEFVSAGNATISGILRTNGVRSDGQAEFKAGLTSDKTIITEALSVNGSSVFGQGLTVTGESTFSGGITTLPKDTSTLGIVNVSGSISQTDNTLVNQFAGKTFLNNEVVITSDLNVKGVIKTGTTNSGCLIEANTIRLVGDTSSVVASNATFDKITGKSKITVSGVGGSSIASKLASVSNKDYTTIQNAYIEDTQVNRGDVVCLGTLYVGGIQTIEVPGSQSIFNESSATLNMRVARARYAP